MTPSGIEPATFWFVAQYPNHCATAQCKVLYIITVAPRYVPNEVIKRDLQLLSVRQEMRHYSVTCRRMLDDHPNSLAKSLFERTNYNRRLKWYYPADLATRH
jgi:hypothetical protein